MSRRRPARHLERTEAGAAVVEEVLESRGLCPGSCNRVYRLRLTQWEVLVDELLDVVLEEVRASLEVQLAAEHGRGPGPVLDGMVAEALLAVDLDSVRGEAERRASEKMPLPVPRKGRPVWCLPCASEVRAALERIPRLVVLTLETGESPARRPNGSLVTDPVSVLDAGVSADGRLTVERLSCGHRRTWRGWGPSPSTRLCWTCVAGAIVPEPGRLAPVERAARAGARQPVSPAGSPAWLEADAAIQWACSTAEQIAYALRTPLDEDRWQWRSGSAADRVAAVDDATRWLRRRLEQVLDLPDPIPTSFGRAARQIAGRLAAVSGEKITVHHLEDPCPRCDRRGMEREDGGSLVRCRSCGAHWDESHFPHLVRAVADGVAR